VMPPLSKCKASKVAQKKECSSHSKHLFKNKKPFG
jgi:hypothetical protein